MEKTAQRDCRQEETSCPVCHDHMEIFAVGSCDHPVCHKCATRMRALCNLTYCPICRADLQKVFLVHRQCKFDNIDVSSFCINRKFMMFFEDEQISKKFNELLQHRCTVCTDVCDFPNFNELRMHIQRQHQLFTCDLCVTNIQLFSVDRKYYTRNELAKHRSTGDQDDRSYRGHPLCKFCDERYFDNDDLLRHLRKQHFFCHFCEADGVTSEYFSDYPLLKEHFRTDHILCEEGECKDTEFVNAFRSDIDYRSHWSQKHSAGAGRQQAKQMRTIQIDFNDGHRTNRPRGGASASARSADSREYSRKNNERPESGRESGSSAVGSQLRERKDAERRRRDELDQAMALSASLAVVQKQGHISVIDPFLAQHSSLIASASSGASSEQPVTRTQYQRRSEDFPTLDNAASAPSVLAKSKKTVSDIDMQESTDESTENQSSLDTLARKLAMSHGQSVGANRMNERDFPSLPSTGDDRKLHSNTWMHSNSKGKKKSAASAWNSGYGSSVANTEVEEFPGLPVTKIPTVRSFALPNSSLSSLSDISRSFSSGNLELMARSQDILAGDSHSWGPELNKPTKSKQKERKDGILRLNTKQKQKRSGEDHKVVGSKSFEGIKDTRRLPEVPQVSVAAENFHEVDNISGNDPFEKVPVKDVKSADKDHSRGSVKSGPVESKNTTASKDKNKSKTEDTDSMPYGKFSVLNDVPEKFQKKQKEPVKQTQAPSETDKSHLNNGQTKKGKQKKQANKSSETAMQKKPEPKNSSITTIEKPAGVSKCINGSSAVELLDKNDPQNENTACSDATNESRGKTSVTECAFENGVESDSHQADVSKAVAFTPDDFPSLPAGKSVSRSQKRCAVPVASSAAMSINNERTTASVVDFPPLHASVNADDVSSLVPVKSSTTAPPGFSAPAKPPPGFMNATPATGKLPPGFSSLPFQLVGSNTEEVRSVENLPPEKCSPAEYIAPRDAKERGARLFQMIATSLGHNEVLSFRELSRDFRQGNISASDYHTRCRKIIGNEQFDKVFPELVALLPDIPKQRQLMHVHREAIASSKDSGKSGGAWSIVSPDILSMCVVCGQVLHVNDKREHNAAHNFDSEFPGLRGGVSCGVR